MVTPKPFNYKEKYEWRKEYVSYFVCASWGRKGLDAYIFAVFTEDKEAAYEEHIEPALKRFWRKRGAL